MNYALLLGSELIRIPQGKKTRWNLHREKGLARSWSFFWASFEIVAVELMQISKKCVSWKRGIPNSRYKLCVSWPKKGDPKKGSQVMRIVAKKGDPQKNGSQVMRIVKKGGSQKRGFQRFHVITFKSQRVPPLTQRVPPLTFESDHMKSKHNTYLKKKGDPKKRGIPKKGDPQKRGIPKRKKGGSQKKGDPKRKGGSQKKGDPKKCVSWRS